MSFLVFILDLVFILMITLCINALMNLENTISLFLNINYQMQLLYAFLMIKGKNKYYK